MDTLKFTILLNPVTKKNSQQIITVGGHPRIIPSKAYREYEENCGWFLPKVEVIAHPVNIKAKYYMQTHRKVDLCNLHEALHDVLVKYRIIEDDNSRIVVSTDGSRVLYDKDHPRTEVEITEVE
jgi:Holliday junction resolvase RusA-like endonuclease